MKMVVTHSLKEIYAASIKISEFKLPQHKEIPFKIEFGKSKDAKTQFNGPEPLLPFAASEVVHTSILSWRRLTADDKNCKAVYEVTFDVTDKNLCFKPGNTIGIIPHNRKADVDFIINHLNLTHVADLSYTLSIDSAQNCLKTKIPAHIPIISTIRHVLTHCLDLRTVPKKLFLHALSKYTKDETERRVLEYLSSKEGTATYTTHILNTNTCLLDLLENFKTCKPPMEILLQHLPRLLPRPYSIVNSHIKDPNIIKICISVMDIGNNRKGLTTGWIESIILNKHHSLEDGLKNLSLTDKEIIPIYLRKNINYFELPEKVDAPLILIGPGTGVAPYIGFLEEIEHTNLNETCPIWLFFGCRNPKLDFIYKEELNIFLEKKILSSLYTAFSRYENNEFKYVQDLIKENGEHLVKLINEGAKIFVCGDHKTMATQVKDALANSLVQHNGNTMEEAEKILNDMQKNKSYIVDIWS